MTRVDSYVTRRFDALEARFQAEIDVDDFRLRSLDAFYALPKGGRILDLGCGKGRFASILAGRGFEVVGLDPSAGMLRSANGIDRVRATARRLPFGSGAFDAVLAVEVLEHLDRAGLDRSIDEVARVLKPGGVASIVDKNLFALDAGRPWLPAFAVKRIDEARGLWMYPPGSPFRERWFRPGGMRARLARRFEAVEVDFLLAPAERKNAVHRLVPGSRLHALWTARRPGGGELG